jgi:hypothetical protein
MSESTQNRDLLAQLRASIAAFAAGDTDLDGIQSALQTTMTLLENDSADAAQVVRLAEADVEEIRFTRLLAEQRDAVLRRMEELAAALPVGPE